MDAKGKSGGLLLGWRLLQFQFVSPRDLGSGLCTSLYYVELKVVFCFINLYGPYADRERFWKNISSLECLKNTNIIFGGDFNFSLVFS